MLDLEAAHLQLFQAISGRHGAPGGTQARCCCHTPGLLNWAGSGGVYFLVYVSAAVTWFSESELRALLTSARFRNERAGITGMLLYKDGNFMQALEGPEAAVRALYKRIEADRRHCGLVVLDCGTRESRQFARWSMAFHDISQGRGEMPSGYSRFLDEPLNSPVFAQQPGRCHELLQRFKELD